MRKYFNFVTCLFIIIICFTISGCGLSKTIYVENLFSEGLLPVASDTFWGYWGYINEKGEKIIDFKYNEAGQFYKGSAIVKKGSQYVLINKKGEEISEAYYYLFRDFETGYVWYYVQGKYGLMDQKGNIIMEPLAMAEGSSAPWFSSGLAKITVDYKNQYINTKGKLITIDTEYRFLDYFSNGYGIFYTENNKCGAVDSQGQVVVEAVFDSIHAFDKNGFALASKDNEPYFIDGKGKIIMKYQDTIYFDKGYFIKEHETYVLYDNKMKKVKVTEYTQIDLYNRNFIVKDKAGNVSFMDSSGEIIYKNIGRNQNVKLDNFRYYLVTYYDNSQNITVSIGGKDYPIDGIVNFGNIKNRLVIASYNGNPIVKNFDNKSIFDFELDNVRIFDDGYIIVGKDNKFGVYDYSGKVVFDLKFKGYNLSANVTPPEYFTY